MYIEHVPNRNSPPAILLRESYRDGNTVKKRTLANEYMRSIRLYAVRALLGSCKSHNTISASKLRRTTPFGLFRADEVIALRVGWFFEARFGNVGPGFRNGWLGIRMDLGNKCAISFQLFRARPLSDSAQRGFDGWSVIPVVAGSISSGLTTACGGVLDCRSAIVDDALATSAS